MELICVVMRAPDWFQDTYKLMNYAYSQYETAKIMPAQTPLKAVKIWGGRKDYVLIGVKDDVLCPLKKGADNQITVMYDLPKDQKAPIHRWQEAGQLKVYVNGNYLYSKPLFYLEDVGKKCRRCYYRRPSGLR
jgi:D-alanyl-D-alanine carboxypeptidase